MKKILKLFAFVFVISLIISALPCSINSEFNYHQNKVIAPKPTSSNNDLTIISEQVNQYQNIQSSDWLYGDALKNAVLSINDIPEVISAECIAENKHVNRLYSEEKDLNTIVFQNRDGGKTIYLFNEPIKYIDNQGNIKDKSTKIKQVEQTSLSSIKTDIAYIVDDNNFKASFASSTQKGVTLDFKDYKFVFYPYYTENELKTFSIVNDTKIKKESTHALSDSSIRERILYNNAFGKNTVLQYTPCLSGIKEDIILNQYSGINSFSFIYETNGAKIVKNNDMVKLIDPENNYIIAKFDNIISYDSNGKTSNGELTVQEIIPNERYKLNIVVDNNFLSSVNTSYPVHIDPTISFDENYNALTELAIYQPSAFGSYMNSSTVNVGNNWEYAGSKVRMLYGFTQSYLTSSGLRKTLDGYSIFSANINIYTNTESEGQNVSIYPYISNWVNDTGNNGYEYASNSYFNAYAEGEEEEYRADTYVSEYFSGWQSYDIKPVIDYWLIEGTNDTSFVNGLILINQNETNGSETDYLSLNTTRNINYNNIYISINVSEYKSDNNLIMDSSQQYLYLKNVNNSSVSLYHPTTNVASHKWKLQYLGDSKYIIRPQNNVAKALVPSGNNVTLSTVSYNSTDNNAIWTITKVNNGTRIKNLGTNKYLKFSNNTMTLATQSEFFSATNQIPYTWNVFNTIKTSGGEKEYNPNAWNYSSAFEANCYAYALDCNNVPYISSLDYSNLQSYANKNIFFSIFMTPGQSSIINGTLSMLNQANIEANGSKILEFVNQDKLIYKFNFEPIGRDDKCPSGSYKVALVVDSGNDFHWYRQNKDGTWSHKPGKTNVTNLDNSNNIIYDPMYANRNNASANLNYESFIGFFAMSPIGSQQ